MLAEAVRTVTNLKGWTPKTDLGGAVFKVLTGGYNIPRELREELLENISKCVVGESTLKLRVYRRPDSIFRVGNGLVTPDDLMDRGVKISRMGLIEDYGIVCRRVVTNNGVALIVDALDNTLTDATIKFHGIGTGGTAEAAADSALVTELTTQYNPDNTRATGVFSQPSANISQSVATNTVDAVVAITEHGVFSQAATGGGVLLDRSLFSVVNLASGDSLQSTYAITFTSGG